jgi:hypothetical protein
MLRILGNPKRCCDGLRRRDFLQVATLGLGGIAAGQVLRQPGAQATTPGACSQTTRGAKAKSVLVLFLYGAPSQMVTFDPKPDAPAETHGEFKAIPTRIPGVRISEHLPHIAGLLDRVTLIRSLIHPYPIHAALLGEAFDPVIPPERRPLPDARPGLPRPARRPGTAGSAR